MRAPKISQFPGKFGQNPRAKLKPMAPTPGKPKSVGEFRELYRREVIPGAYSGVVHGAFAATTLVGAAVLSTLRVRHMTSLEWLTIPAVFLFGNLLEYWMHRIPLHRTLPGAGMIFKIHTLEHHRFFTPEFPSYESPRDFHTVFFPVWAPLLALLIFECAGKWLLTPFLSRNIAALFTSFGALYFLMYEVFHFSHHRPGQPYRGKKDPLSRVMEFSRAHHTLHHAPERMTRKNFNVTLPLCDWLFGTLGKNNSEDSA